MFVYVGTSADRLSTRRGQNIYIYKNSKARHKIAKVKLPVYLNHIFITTYFTLRNIFSAKFYMKPIKASHSSAKHHIFGTDYLIAIHKCVLLLKCWSKMFILN